MDSRFSQAAAWAGLLLVASIAGVLIVRSTSAPPAGRGRWSGPTPQLWVSTLERFDFGRPWRGDLDGMLERGLIRALVPHSRTHFFLDGGRPRGLSYELLRRFERYLNGRYDTPVGRLHLVVIPTGRDKLLEGLERGYGDIAAGNLTITAPRRERVRFSAPLIADIDEIVVTDPAGPPLASLDDLAGTTLHVSNVTRCYPVYRLMHGPDGAEGPPPGARR